MAKSNRDIEKVPGAGVEFGSNWIFTSDEAGFNFLSPDNRQIGVSGRYGLDNDGNRCASIADFYISEKDRDFWSARSVLHLLEEKLINDRVKKVYAIFYRTLTLRFIHRMGYSPIEGRKLPQDLLRSFWLYAGDLTDKIVSEDAFKQMIKNGELLGQTGKVVLMKELASR